MSTIPLRIEFSGGLEAYFSNRRKHSLALPSQDDNGAPATINSLVRYLHEKVMKYGGAGEGDPFVVGGSVRPGILVLINEADWELEGEGEYVLQSGDEVIFMSTLHGG